jgi:hypothetical protein
LPAGAGVLRIFSLTLTSSAIAAATGVTKLRMFLLPFMTARTGSSEPKEEIKNWRLGQTSPERSF